MPAFSIFQVKCSYIWLYCTWCMTVNTFPSRSWLKWIIFNLLYCSGGVSSVPLENFCNIVTCLLSQSLCFVNLKHLCPCKFKVQTQLFLGVFPKSIICQQWSQVPLNCQFHEFKTNRMFYMLIKAIVPYSI